MEIRHLIDIRWHTSHFRISSSKMSEQQITHDDTSSIYSRPIDSTKDLLMPRAANTLPAKHDLPEINSLDHQIAMARGSTMALETTRVRLKSSKSEHRRSLPETRCEKLRQWEQQKYENEFYQSCFYNFHELSKSAIDAIEDFTPQSYFEPECTSVRNLKALQAIRHLREILEKSKALEARAEEHWKSQWNPSRTWNPTSRWIWLIPWYLARSPLVGPTGIAWWLKCNYIMNIRISYCDIILWRFTI